MKVRFTHTRVVDDLRKGTPDEERFEAGQVYDLPEATARRWMARNVAVLAKDEPLAPQGTTAGGGPDPGQWFASRPPDDRPILDAKAAALSIADMVTEWVDGGIKGGTDWRPGLPVIIELRLKRFAEASPGAGQQPPAQAGSEAGPQPPTDPTGGDGASAATMGAAPPSPAGSEAAADKGGKAGKGGKGK